MHPASIFIVILLILFSDTVSADGANTKIKAGITKAALPGPVEDEARKPIELGSNQAVRAAGASSKLNSLRQIESSNNRPTRLPERKTSDAAAGTALEGRATIGRGPGKDADEMVREVMGLGGGGFGSAQIGRAGGNGYDASRYGSGSAADAAGAPRNPGHSSSQGRIARLDYSSSDSRTSTSYTARFAHVSGRVSQVGESWSNNKFGGETYVATHTVTDSEGNVTYQVEHTEVTDRNGDVISDTDRESGAPLSADDQEDLNQAIDEILAEFDDAGQDAPTDNATGKGGTCNPVTGFGCEKRKSDYMDKLMQPAHGNEIKTMAGTGGKPNAGPSSVTNPGNHDGSSTGRDGRSGGRPGESAVDPEEIIPRAGLGSSF